MTTPSEALAGLTRPIIGIENRTAQEVFDIMCGRIEHSTAQGCATAFDEDTGEALFLVYWKWMGWCSEATHWRPLPPPPES